MRLRALRGVVFLAAVLLPKVSAGEVKIEMAGEDRYDISVEGARFTSYQFSPTKFSEKPIFYPVFSPKGAEVNRRFPMVRDFPGEEHDHPHHQSCWFTYGDVNGTDYWNRDVKSKRRIAHKSAEVAGDTLKIALAWIDPQEEVVLEEQKNVTFGGGPGVRWMDHDMTLTAAKRAVIGDSKEGAFGMRVSGRLQEEGGTGRYLNAEGKEGSGEVWGKTSPWVALRGKIAGADGKDEEVTLAIFSHPSTVNHPPCWHARDYGLFTVNPFGRRGYDKTAEPRETVLEPGQSVHLRMKLVIYEGIADAERLARDYAEYARP